MAGTGPCFNCKDRHMACHMVCFTYKKMVIGFKRRAQKEKAKCKSIFIHEAKEHRKESDAEPMKNPCKACAELICMGLCWERIEYLEWYREYCDRVRQQIKDVSRRGERDRKGTE